MQATKATEISPNKKTCQDLEVRLTIAKLGVRMDRVIAKTAAAATYYFYYYYYYSYSYSYYHYHYYYYYCYYYHYYY